MTNITLNISIDLIAWYGAIVATLSMLSSIYFAYRDKPKIKIKYQPNMCFLDSSRGYDQNKTYFNITVINIGRRPIKITKAALKLIDNKRSYYLLSDSFSPYRNRILTETSPSTEFLLEQDDAILKKALCICIYDATGKKYKKYMHLFPTFWKYYYLIMKIFHKNQN